MKLSLTLPELEAGKKVERVSDKRYAELTTSLNTQTPLSMARSLPLDKQTVGLVVLRSVTRTQTGCEIQFIPVSCGAFVVYDRYTKGLNALVVEFTDGQMEFTSSGSRASKYSLCGPGVNPECRQKAVELMAKLVSTESSDDLVRLACGEICRRAIASAKSKEEQK